MHIERVLLSIYFPVTVGEFLFLAVALSGSKKLQSWERIALRRI
jgi:hypothetical protein